MPYRSRGADRDPRALAPLRRVRAALAATLALAVASAGFTVAQFSAQVRTMTGQTPDDYSTAGAPTICATCAANSSSPNPAAPAATT
jgi:hypothetical protein